MVIAVKCSSVLFLERACAVFPLMILLVSAFPSAPQSHRIVFVHSILFARLAGGGSSRRLKASKRKPVTHSEYAAACSPACAPERSRYAAEQPCQKLRQGCSRFSVILFAVPLVAYLFAILAFPYCCAITASPLVSVSPLASVTMQR